LDFPDVQRWSGVPFLPWDGFPLPPPGKGINQNNSWELIQQESARLADQHADFAKWQKIVCSMLKLPFAVDADGVLLPSFYQGLVQIHEVSIFGQAMMLHSLTVMVFASVSCAIRLC